ncbi:hypothetical protein HNR44_002679 [Geomicrobium halophilum]|uniref:Spore coat protein Z n=1 Tax=Geomicrobium halophilum TaxID=549000 RepID=A0A841PPL9_9BACL|nr:hypothetical protein [Geomicrobium halophilum]
MNCGPTRRRSRSPSRLHLDCICATLADIVREQNKAGNCVNSCYHHMLARQPVYQTVPVVFTTNLQTPFCALGDIEDRDCFTTIYFRVEEVDERKDCVTLELLKPVHSRGIHLPSGSSEVHFEQVSGSAKAPLILTRTGQCILVKCDCLCSVQCLDPTIVR